MDDLNTLLEERVADIPVGAPPIDAMRSAVRRRRSRMTALGAAAAVAVIAAGGVAWQQLDEPAARPPVASDPPADPDAPPEGSRYVGYGPAVIAVPEAWGTNDTECGTPQEDTVVIDQGAICLALIPRPADVESVEVRPGETFEDTSAWTSAEIDGEEALRSPVETADGLTSGSVYLPELGVTFVAQSSSADGEAIVENLLAGVTILEEHTTVPGFALLEVDAYAAELQELGLAVEIVTDEGRTKGGWVLSTDPAVGSVVAPGDTITVTVAR
ncbi:PASTA domain-containing protein [Nocardioides sp. SR21]|uniref:PASTA domain-containing protein n=1 Tax=Nocardioides sp. SR21 TaxID=2919501 RepID=UPI001FAACD13|nr:PASTA domain-containing protein [Nocardioides sp. SR21]